MDHKIRNISCGCGSHTGIYHHQLTDKKLIIRGPWVVCTQCGTAYPWKEE